MSLTTDPTDPRLGRGVDDQPIPQNAVYLVLSEEERAKGFVRPVRHSYVHVGPPGPKHAMRDLTADEVGASEAGYVKFEEFPPGSHGRGRYWDQAQLDAVGKGCGVETTMGQALAETYAREPRFYGATYCVGCRKHRPVGELGEFVWSNTTERVGT